ncbi:hypothetical protein PV04_10433 [Phialophora macrospora]|uniref:Uncharacterized protein n=1 Tax=Phialophora macrospora TaxID=1851006 RepID=A0A0D2F2R9_9EURO|nr:hypothetical protein PV04_10433 [Phialophora macrospora]
MDLPFLNIKGADVLEDVTYLKQRHGDVHHVAAVMLLKLKLHIDIINIKLVRKVIAARLPPELWGRVEAYVPRSPVSAQWVGKPYGEITRTQCKLEVQVKLLSGAIRNINPHFAGGLLDPDEYLSSRPGYYSPGSPEEVQLLLHYSYTAWWQHEGVLELLQSAKSIAGKDSEDEIEDMMEGTTFRNNPGSDRTKEELLDDVSRNRLWAYIDYAVADAMSLSENRPSDVKMLQTRQRNRELLAEEYEDEDEDEDEYEYDSDSE